MRKTDVAYVAGFFDGEGAIGVSLQKGKYVRIEVGTSQNTREVLTWMEHQFGGAVYGNADQGYQWKLFGSKGIEFLKLVLPFLIVKSGSATEAMRIWECRDQLDLVTELIRTRKERTKNGRDSRVASRKRYRIRRGLEVDGSSDGTSGEGV